MSDDAPKEQYILNDIQELKKDVKDLLQRDVADKQSIRSLSDQMGTMITRQEQQNEILRQNTESLKEHIRRTNLLEESTKDISTRFKPIEDNFKHSTIVRKFLTNKAVIITAILTFVVSAIKIYLFLSGKPY